jgi:hypothetical protein
MSGYHIITLKWETGVEGGINKWILKMGRTEEKVIAEIMSKGSA